MSMQAANYYSQQTGNLDAATSVNNLSELVKIDSEVNSFSRFQLLVSGFVLANFLLFRFLNSISTFSDENNNTYLIAALVFTFLVTLQVLASLTLFKIALKQISNGKLALSFILALSIIVLYLGLLLEITANFESYSVQLKYSNYIYAIFVIHFLIYIKESFDKNLDLLIKDFFNLVPKQVRLVASASQTSDLGALNDRENLINSALLRAGDIIRLYPGDTTPSDCLVKEGTVEVQSFRPKTFVFKYPGDRLSAGSRIQTGTILAEVLVGMTNSKIHFENQNLLHNLKLSNNSNIANYVTYFVYFITFWTACAFFYWREQGQVATIWMQTASAVLLSTAFIFSLLVLERQNIFRILVALNNSVLIASTQVFNKLARINTFGINFDLNDHPGSIRVSKLKVLDDRVEKETIYNLLYQILGSFNGELNLAVIEYLKDKIDQVRIKKIENLRLFDNFGLSGTVENAQFLLGSEDFLLAKGVQLHPDDLLITKEHEFVVYFVVASQVLARITFIHKFYNEARELVDYLRKKKIKLALSSNNSNAHDVLDHYGKLAGIDLAEIYGVNRSFATVISNQQALIFSREAYIGKALRLAECSDEKSENAQIVLFNPSWLKLKDFLQYCYSSLTKERIIFWLGATTSIVMIVLSLTRTVSFYQSAIVLLITQLIIYLILYIELKKAQLLS